MTNPQHSETVKHTPIPWRVGDPAQRITEQDIQVMAGDVVLTTGNYHFPEARANAAHIVFCVNGRDALVEALRDIYYDCVTPDTIPTNQAALALIRRRAIEALKKAGAL